MSPQSAYEVLSAKSPIDVGRFYGSTDKVGLGAGLIYDKVLSPLFSQRENLFLTVRQPVYVLTHECDVDAANDRPLNDSVCFCPVIPLPSFIRRFEEQWKDDAQLNSFLANVAERKVGRVVYLPPGPSFLEYGGFIYLNAIGSTHVSCFEGVQPVVALSEYGLRELDVAVKNSLLRPKAERLSFLPS